MYLLMNKNKAIAEITKNWQLQSITGKTPLGCQDFSVWLSNRKAYKHNEHLKKLMFEYGCDTNDGFIKITHAASINDAYWIKEEKESVEWEDISFYTNDFNETVSKLAFAGLGLYGQSFSSTIPEFTTDGSFRKCWRREDGKIYLYKQGYDIGYNAGLEPYCEVMASELIQKICPDSVSYQLAMIQKVMTSKCLLFTNEEYGFLSLKNLFHDKLVKDIPIGENELLAYYENLGCEDEFRRMMVMDAVTFNTDRHLGNIGVLIQNDTQEVTKIAPNFDYNLSMLPYVLEDEFDDIGTKLLDYGPKIGLDFVSLGQQMLTEPIRRDLLDLKDYEFSFRGDNKFQNKRVKRMEEIIQKQISAILSSEKLLTKDVFIPKIKNVIAKKDDFSSERIKADEVLERFAGLGYTQYIEEDEYGHLFCHFGYQEATNYIEYIVSMQNDNIQIEKDGISISEDSLSDNSKSKYRNFCRKYDDYSLLFYSKYSNINS